jgi:hypothetical protein
MGFLKAIHSVVSVWCYATYRRPPRPFVEILGYLTPIIEDTVGSYLTQEDYEWVERHWLKTEESE